MTNWMTRSDTTRRDRLRLDGGNKSPPRLGGGKSPPRLGGGNKSPPNTTLDVFVPSQEAALNENVLTAFQQFVPSSDEAAINESILAAFQEFRPPSEETAINESLLAAFQQGPDKSDSGGCAFQKTAKEMKKSAKEMKKKFVKYTGIPLAGVLPEKEQHDLVFIPNQQYSSFRNSPQHLPGIQEIFEEHAFPDISLEQVKPAPLQQDNKKGNFQKGLMRMVGGKHFTFITNEQKKELRDKINMDYHESLLEHHSLLGNINQTSSSEAIHHAAAYIIQEFLASRPIFAATNMPSTNEDAVYEVVQDFIYPQFVSSYSPMENVTPADAAKAISWIDSFLETMKSECPDSMIRQEWVRDRDDLVVHYIVKGVKREMNECLNRAMHLQSEDDIRQDSDGYLVTGFPGQIAFLFHQQLSVAQTALPSMYHEVVLAACNQEMVQIGADMQLKISNDWKDISSSYFCALINDASILSEQCEERNDLFLQSGEFKNAGDALVRDLVEFSLHTTRYLCEHIMFDVTASEPILQSVGSAAWEGDTSHAATERMIATFKDYFNDLETWIISSDYYFPKILKICLDSTLETYMKSFFSNTMANGVKDAAVVADELRDDYVRLAGFFNGPSCDKYHGSGGFYTQHAINERLRMLQSMATLVDPTTRPMNEIDDIKAVLSEFHSGGQASAIVLHLAGLHKCRRKQESAEWVKAIARAKKKLDAENNNNNKDQSDNDRIGMLPTSSLTSPIRSYNVPDLKQSRYVYNIRPTSLEKKVSAGTLLYAGSTLELLKTPGLNNRVRFGIQTVTSPQLTNQVQMGIQSVSPGLMDRILLGIQKIGLK